jgi:hypothetical protein
VLFPKTAPLQKAKVEPTTAFRYRRSFLDRVGLAVLGVFLSAAAAALLAGALLGSKGKPVAEVLLLFAGAINAAYAFFVAREWWSRVHTLVVIYADKLRLDLPARRGYLTVGPCVGTILLESISSIDERWEAFRTLGHTVLQRSFRIGLKDGTYLFLGADRRMSEGYYERVAVGVSARMKVPIKERGMVEGNPGTFLLWGESVPDWDSPPLPDDVAEKRLREAANATRVLWAAIGLMFLAAVVAAFV